MSRTINKAYTEKCLDCTLLALTALCNVLFLCEMPRTNYLSVGLIKINEASVMDKGGERVRWERLDVLKHDVRQELTRCISHCGVRVKKQTKKTKHSTESRQKSKNEKMRERDFELCFCFIPLGFVLHVRSCRWSNSYIVCTHFNATLTLKIIVGRFSGSQFSEAVHHDACWHHTAGNSIMLCV